MVIQCTNPTCKTSIPVPEGASYVVCSVCNTWHFPSDFDNAASDSAALGMIDYALPSEQASVLDTPTPPPPPRNDPYPQPESGAAIPSFNPTFHQTPEPKKKESPTIGWILLPDGVKLQLQTGRNIIGRQCGNLSIHDNTVSRKHCVIEVLPNATPTGFDYLLYDVAGIGEKRSTNGVFVAGRSLRLQDTEKIPVYNGSTITLGSIRITLQCPT